MTPAPASHVAAAPAAPLIKIKPHDERVPVSFSPTIRRMAHILYAAKGPVSVQVIADNAAIEPNNVMSFISSVRTAIGGTGATIAVSTVDDTRCYRLHVPNRAAFERLVGPAPEGVIADDVAFHGFTGQKAVVLRALVEADGAYISLGSLMVTVYGRETARARDKIVGIIRLIRQNLLVREDPGAILARGTGLQAAFAWAPQRDARTATDTGPVKRLEGVTLPAIGCETWRFHPSTGSRPSAHVVRLRGEDQDRVLTDAELAMRPELSALSAPHGTWPPARDEDREAA
ncbi:hypothetical protein ACLBYG_21905 [Methylobacterium sp. D53M]